MSRYPRQEVKLGHKINRLTVIDDTPIKVRSDTGSVYTKYKVQCECGVITEAVKCTLFNGKIKSCGCAQYDDIRKAFGYSPAYKLFCDYRVRADNKMPPLPFELTFEKFVEITSANCNYCGLEPHQKRRNKRASDENFYIYNGVDRKDNTKGYTLANSVPCCRFCNTAKASMTEAEFVIWMKRVLNFMKEKDAV